MVLLRPPGDSGEVAAPLLEEEEPRASAEGVLGELLCPLATADGAATVDEDEAEAVKLTG